jgi:hypothetical protein
MCMWTSLGPGGLINPSEEHASFGIKHIDYYADVVYKVDICHSVIHSGTSNNS